jgi:GNAT superfamily N-acetyltransferase
MIEIAEVRSRSELRRFVALPETLYRAHPCYVPKLFRDEIATLSRETNPAFEYCEARYWLACRDGAPVGRIAGIINRRDIATWKCRRARFGWVDFVDDPEVSAALLSTVESWARERGLEAVPGPLGFCDLDREGMLVEGFDELDMLVTNYNYPYYPAHLEHLGYTKDVDWVEFLVTPSAEIPAQVDRVAQCALKRYGLRIVTIARRRDILPHTDGIFSLINDAYKGLYGVVPLSAAQISYYTKMFFGFVNPEYLKVILDRDGHVAAFGIAMPSMSQALQRSRGRLFPLGFAHLLWALRFNDRLDLLLTAVRPDLQNRGINAILISEMWKAAVKHGIRHAETGPELESNDKIQAQWKHFQTRQHRRRRCFCKAL